MKDKDRQHCWHPVEHTVSGHYCCECGIITQSPDGMAMAMFRCRGGSEPCLGRRLEKRRASLAEART